MFSLGSYIVTVSWVWVACHFQETGAGSRPTALSILLSPLLRCFLNCYVQELCCRCIIWVRTPWSAVLCILPSCGSLGWSPAATQGSLLPEGWVLHLPVSVRMRVYDAVIWWGLSAHFSVLLRMCIYNAVRNCASLVSGNSWFSRQEESAFPLNFT